MILGIDLGTTNSLIAYLKDGVAQAIPNAFGQLLTPSVVSIDDTGAIHIGAAARERMYNHPNATVGSFKRMMGTQQAVKLGKQTFTPEELSALVLRSLKADAEALLGTVVTEVIISVPAYFNDAQRKSTLMAGELAGLTVKRLINEPTAAALFHGIQDQDSEAKFLIFDLGGGTFDVSILEKFEGIMEVRATGGDSFLGGDDFTEILINLFIQKSELKSISAKNTDAMAAIRFIAEDAKRKLTEVDSVTMDVKLDGKINTVVISQAEYEIACKPLLDRLRIPIERALKDARLRTADLSELVMVGGATRMPLVRKLVAQLFGRLPARYIDPDQTIALGAAVCAGLTSRDIHFEEVVLTDVCPHSLGTEVAEVNDRDEIVGTVFMPIIERNTIVPASRVKTVYTVKNNQILLTIKIYQGESRDCKNNNLLETLEIKVPPLARGDVSADIRYTYDINGILEVDVNVEKTGLRKNVLIKKLAGNVSDIDIQNRSKELAALKIHPREQAENRLLLERAERLFEQFTGDERQMVSEFLGKFVRLLESQDPNLITKARSNFEHALDSLEHGEIF